MEQEMINKVLDQSEKLLSYGKEFLQEDGHLEPIAFIFKESDNTKIAIPIGSLLSDETSKDMLPHYLYEICHQYNPDAVIMIVESWMVKADNQEDFQKIGRPSEHPNRVEAINMTIQLRDGNGYMKNSEIKRDKNGNAIDFTDWEMVQTPIQGRMAIPSWDPKYQPSTNKIQ